MSLNREITSIPPSILPIHPIHPFVHSPPHPHPTIQLNFTPYPTTHRAAIFTLYILSNSHFSSPPFVEKERRGEKGKG